MLPFVDTSSIFRRPYWIKARTFNLKEDMTNLYPFIQGSLEWPYSKLFSANVSLRNQYKSIRFNIFSCRIVIISYKMLIITGIFNEKTNELTIYRILCQNVTTFYQWKYFKMALILSITQIKPVFKFLCAVDK